MVISFYTLGCRLNQAEEESLRRQFMEAGFLVSDPKSADICIVNTCSVTAVADQKSRQQIRHLKSQNPNLKMVVIGCGAEGAKDLAESDLVILNKDKDNAFKIIISKFNVLNQFEKLIIKDSYLNTLVPSNRGKNLKFKTKNYSTRTRALLKVQDGCNNFCAYCIVPHLRGREVSLPAEKVIAEAKKLRGMGYEELVLSGVNVGRYESNGFNLTKLIKKILAETDFPRIRLSSINPQDITEEMLELWLGEPRLCRHFHLSLQSGSNAVLKRMGRPYTANEYLKLSNKIVQMMPEMAITTDVIVGFPGETEEEFAETVEFVKEANLAKLHVFPYSERAGTRAAVMPNSVPKEVRKERSKMLREVGAEIEQKFKSKFIGQEMEVLFEEKKNDFWYGLTSNYIRVKHKAEGDLTNKFANVRINKDNFKY